MRRLILTCECGERMKVPRTALGKTGLCPSCGTKINIGRKNTRTVWLGGGNGTGERPFRPEHSEPEAPDAEAKQRFAYATDLYFAQRYAQALAVFLSLCEKYPGNAEVEKGRELCLKALQTRPVLALEDKRAQTGASFPAVGDDDLTAATVKRFILEKMFNSPSQEVQLRAAELASRLLGLGNTDGDTQAEVMAALAALKSAHDAGADQETRAGEPAWDEAAR